MTDAERELITRAAMLERCLLLEDELAARRAAVAAANAHEMSPDFDEPMELVESKRLRYLEEVARAWIHRHDQRMESAVHQATCPTCGQPMPGGVPAQPAPTTYDASGDRGVVPVAPPKKTWESWRDREPLA